MGLPALSSGYRIIILIRVKADEFITKLTFEFTAVLNCNIWEGIIMGLKNILKRIASVSAAAVLSVTSLGISRENRIADAATSMTAQEIVSNISIGWNLGNSLDATGSGSNPGLSTETAWGNPKTTQALIDAVKAKGFNTIRIPTTWYQHLDSNNNIDSAWMARVKEVVNYAYNNDMYVILNVHHEEWINRSDIGTAYNEMSPKLKAIWKQIATEFADYDQHLIFEGMNEPRAADTTHEWWGPQDNECDTINKLNQDFVDTVRSVSSPYQNTRLLMVPPYCASSDISIFSKLVVPNDPYICVSIHAYSPYNFTMGDGPHTSFDTDALYAIFNNIKSTFIDKGIPVIIGEFGASNYNNTDARINWAKTYLSKTEEIGIPCVLWDNNVISNPSKPGEAHGYLNRGSLQWYEESEPVVDAMIATVGATSTDYTPSEIVIDDNCKNQLGGSTIQGGGEEQEQFTNSYSITEDAIKGKSIAVTFTGATPIICAMDSSWNGWTELEPYTVQDGVAYYSGDELISKFGSGLAWILVGNFSTTPTTVSKIAIVDNAAASATTTTTTTTSTTTAATTTSTVIPGYDKISFTDTINAVYNNGTTNIVQFASHGEYSIGDVQLAMYASQLTGGNTVYIDFFGTSSAIYNINTISVVGLGAATYGDANDDGAVDVADATIILQFLANPSDFSVKNKTAADVSGNGDGVTANDALAIQKYLVGVYSSLPVSE